MTLVSVDALRSRVAARIGALSGWRQSPYLFESLGVDPSSIAHLAFAVGVPTTRADGGRQRMVEGAKVITDLTIRFTARVKPKDAPDSVDDMLQAEQAIINSMMEQSATWPVNLGIHFAGASRTATATAEWLRSDVNFQVLHFLALQ